MQVQSIAQPAPAQMTPVGGQNCELCNISQPGGCFGNWVTLKTWSCLQCQCQSAAQLTAASVLCLQRVAGAEGTGKVRSHQSWHKLPVSSGNTASGAARPQRHDLMFGLAGCSLALSSGLVALALWARLALQQKPAVQPAEPSMFSSHHPGRHLAQQSNEAVRSQLLKLVAALPTGT